MTEYGYDFLKIILSVLEDFAHDVTKEHQPSLIPRELLRSARGWSIRLETIDQKIKETSRSELLQTCGRLASILAELDSYIEKWQQISDNHSPTDLENMDSVRIVAERVNIALYDVTTALFPVEKQSIWTTIFRRR